MTTAPSEREETIIVESNRTAAELRAELAECEREMALASEAMRECREEYDAEWADLQRAYSQAMATHRRILAVWRRRAEDARRRLKESGSPPPISGGAPWSPSAEDWAEYREHFDRLDALERERDIEAFDYRHRND